MNSSACPSSEALSAYFDQESSPEISSSITTHLPGCTNCRAELEWFGLLNEFGPRVEESLPGDNYWEDLPHRILGLVMVEEEAQTPSSSASPPESSGGFWKRLWGPSPSWRYITAGVASLAVIGGAWIITRNQPSPLSDGTRTTEVTAVPTDDVILPPELRDDERPVQTQSAVTFANRVFSTYARDEEDMGQNLDILPGQAVTDQGHSSVGAQVSLDSDMRALADEVLPYGCGEDSLTQVYVAALHAEQAGDFRTAALGYLILKNRVPADHMLHQYADYRLHYLIWKNKMQTAVVHQAEVMEELNRIADRTYQTWEKTSDDVDCRKAWCMNRVLQQLGPEMTEATHLQTASTRVATLENCGQ